jgi:acyl dehydratase
MRLFVDTMDVAGGIIGMGVDELKWPNAVRPGDELRLEIEILEARHSKSRPGYGIIRIRNVTKNQRDEVVQSFMANAMLPTREAGL